MTTTNPAAFPDYKAFIHAIEEQSRGFSRGFRRKLAEAMDCKPAFVSQVLNGPGHLSLEQGYRAAGHFGLNRDAKRYFMLMLELERSGTNDLRAHFEAELEILRPKLLDLKDAVSSQEISPEAQGMYYRHWSYAAIHILTTIPRYRTPLAIAEALSLKEEEARDGIEFLLRVGLLSLEKGQLKPGSKQLHLSRESNWIEAHHTQWRLRAIERLHLGREEDMHYSTVSSLSRHDFHRLKTKMVEWVREYSATVQDSPEEELVAFSIDFYRMT